MKAFIIACAVLVLTVALCITNDVYFSDVCRSIEQQVEEGGSEGAKKALNDFERHEFMLKLSVDNGYVSEAKVSLCSLVAAYEHNDGYEIDRYIYDTSIRVKRIRRSLII